MSEEALVAPLAESSIQLRQEFGPLGRALAQRFFEPVRFPTADSDALAALSAKGFVVHVMRTTTWVNFLYMDWALVKRGLPPIRAAVNLSPWWTKPYTHLMRDHDLETRFTRARDSRGSAMIFLRESAFNTARGQHTRSDPFPALVNLAQRSSAPIYLVPELLVWEKWQQKVRPSVWDRVFGSPEAPGFLHTLTTFARNYERAQLRLAEPIDLAKFVKENAGESVEVLARKVRGTLHHYLGRETRAVFGPPRKPVDRLIDEAMRDRQFQDSVKELALQTGKPLPTLEREAKRNFNTIAARYSPTVVGFLEIILHWVFHRIYDGIEVDEAGLERAMKAAALAPVVLTPSHKSHVDYLIMSYVLFRRGYTTPQIAAGANLSFFPLGAILRRGGAFFLRRSFKGDKLYTATFKAYLKKLVHDGIHHEFFPEGGRSRTGKLLAAKLGLFTWLVDAVLEGARDDLLFVPAAIDYEKVVEGASYTAELKGGEKKPEDLKALLAAPKVLTENYGRIHLTFDAPISLAALMKERGLTREAVTEDQKKALVRALGHRVMYGISRVSTVTPHALLGSALLAHRRRGVSVREITDRVVLLRRIVTELGAPLSKQLDGAPASPTVLGPIKDAMSMFASEGFVRIAEALGEPIYQVEDDHRSELSFYKNTVLNLVAGRTIVSAALLAAEPAGPLSVVRERALFLSRLYKFEFVYPVGKTFEHIFDETVAHLHSLGLVERTQDTLTVSPEDHARPLVQFLADMTRDYLESYLLTAVAAQQLTGSLEKKELLKRTLENGRAAFLGGTIGCAEALSKTNFENALLFLIDQGYLKDEEKKVAPGPEPLGPLVEAIKRFLPNA